MVNLETWLTVIIRSMIWKEKKYNNKLLPKSKQMSRQSDVFFYFCKYIVHWWIKCVAIVRSWGYHVFGGLAPGASAALSNVLALASALTETSAETLIRRFQNLRSECSTAMAYSCVWWCHCLHPSPFGLPMTWKPLLLIFFSCKLAKSNYVRTNI